MRKVFFVIAMLALAALGARADNIPIILVQSAPSGACTNGQPMQLVIPTGVLYSCQAGTWGVVGAGAGGPPTGSAGGDLSGTYPNPAVAGIKSVPFCTGYTPTNGQSVVLTTASSPNPCYTAVANLPVGGGTMTGALTFTPGVLEVYGSIPTSDIFIGTTGGAAGNATMAGTQSVGIGQGALASATAPTSGDARNVAIGYQACTAVTTASEVTCIGAGAGKSLIGNGQGIEDGLVVLIGTNAAPAYLGTASTYDTDIVAIGQASALSLVSGALDVFIGNHSGNSITAATGSVIIGDVSLGQSTTETATSSQDVVIGHDAAFSATGTFANNVIIGQQAGYDMTASTGNVIIGQAAAFNQTTANGNTFVGFEAGNANVSGTKDVYLGFQAGLNDNQSDNTLIGYNAGISNVGYQNTFLGEETGGSSQTSGSNANVALGYYACSTLTSGNNNICLGTSSAVSAATDTNEIAIGSSTTGAGSNTVTLGNASITKTLLRGEVTGSGPITLGTNGGTGGSLILNGSSSGSATINTSSTGVLALPSGTTATSMSLTTPLLGTPTSGVITNLTGTCAACTSNVSTNATTTNTTTNASYFIPFFSSSASTTQGLNVYAGLTVNPSTGALGAGGTITAGGAGSGALTLNGSTSGAATITAPAIAGTTTNQIAFSNAFSFPGTSSETYNAIGSTLQDGYQLFNTTAAAVGVQQWSPAVHWQGQGWKTNATAASETVDFQAFVQPVQGSGTPGGLWILQSNINGAGYNNIFQVGNGGAVNAGFSLDTPGHLIDGATFTATGCGTETSLTGGSTGGSFLAQSTTCTAVITMGGFQSTANGWVCNVWDLTTTTDTMKETATNTTTVTFSGTVVSGDKIVFSCMGY